MPHFSFRKMLSVAALDVTFFEARLRKNNPITYVRYGDGEFNAILGKSGENCDHHAYFPIMGDELARTLIESRKGNYLYGIGPKVRSMEEGAEVATWIEQWAPNVNWNSSEAFLHASLEGRFLPLMQELRNRKVLWLAPQHMTKFLLQSKKWLHWLAPQQNAWLEKDQLRQALVWLVQQHKDIELVLFCAGMVSKIMIWELFPHWGAKMHLWDMGSVFDMYCGIDSRSYARRMLLPRKQELYAANFGMEASR